MERREFITRLGRGVATGGTRASRDAGDRGGFSKAQGPRSVGPEIMLKQKNNAGAWFNFR
jgi:hypothetical protein